MKILRILLIVFAATSLLNSCSYNFIVPEEVPVIDPDDPNAPQVSFANDIIPIFVNNNNCSSCHNGNQAPDLRAENAFAAINTSRYINTASPEESRIYKYCSPETTTHMRKKYNSAQAALVLAWIRQGAKNN
ncbi:MAG: hypothetical protein FD181_1037 [Prolixibacteraceae bacterium]|nr:MAG: hypothetical protein FD181_1037 [Prolixibacteraceae bacterium]